MFRNRFKKGFALLSVLSLLALAGCGAGAAAAGAPAKAEIKTVQVSAQDTLSAVSEGVALGDTVVSQGDGCAPGWREIAGVKKDM